MQHLGTTISLQLLDSIIYVESKSGFDSNVDQKYMHTKHVRIIELIQNVTEQPSFAKMSAGLLAH